MNLVIQLARLGDLLQTARLVASLAAEGEVHLLVDDSLTSAARLAYPDATVHGAMLSPHGTAHNAALFGSLQRMPFQRVYNLNHAGLNHALARLFPPRQVRGYVAHQGQLTRDLWMRLALRWTAHRRSSPLNLVDFWGLMADAPVAPEAVNPPALPRSGPLGVALAGRHARRSLAPAVLAPAVHALCESMGGPDIVLLGSKNEREAGRELFRHLPPSTASRVSNLAGRTSLEEVFALVGGLGCLLTPDTGLMHLAARLGVPVQGVFLSSAWAWETGPYGLGHTVWQAAPACAPCAENVRCPHGNDVPRPCLSPFTRDWIKGLCGREAQPAGLWRLESAFDEVGLLWRHGPEDTRRDTLRRLLGDVAGSPRQETADAPALTRAAEQFLTEADWMLPASSQEESHPASSQEKSLPLSSYPEQGAS